MKLFLKLILFIIIYIPQLSLADTFGESCSALPLSDSRPYTINETAFGYVQKLLDMKTHITNGCDPNGGDIFYFCIKNKAGSAEICKAVNMKIGTKAKLGSLTTNSEITNSIALSNVELSVEEISGKVCLMMPTSIGMMPLICRDKIAAIINSDDTEQLCRKLGESCYNGRAKSQSLLSFSGPSIACVRDSLDKIFYVGNECSTDDEEAQEILSTFPEFNASLKKAITALLIIYTIFFAFKIVLNNEYLQLNNVATFILKMIIVSYFAIGLGEKKIQYGKDITPTGMTEFALPLLVDLTSNFTEFVFDSAGSQGLCNFDKSKYQQGYEFYKIWDSIDCRIGYYLGMQVLYNIGDVFTRYTGRVSSNNGSRINWGDAGENGITVLNEASNFAFFSTMFGFFMGGQIIIVIMALMFVVVIISVLIYFMSAYLVCMVTLYVMIYISPIFVPMILFERTKGYFDSWIRIVISCTLQPAVIGGFIAILLTMYDSALFGTCEFQRYDYNNGENNFSTFELRLPNSEASKCEASAGYKLMKYYQAQGWEKKIFILFEVPKINDYFDISSSFLYLIMYVVIFYFFIQYVNEFAAELVGGPSVGSVTVSPNMITDKIKSAAKTVTGMAASAVGGGKSSGGGSKENIAEGAKDMASGGEGAKRSGGASDKFS